MRSAVIAVSLAFAATGPAQAGNPNRSIIPELPKSTPYGLQITRSDDRQLRQATITGTGDMPQLAPYLEAFEAAETEGGPYDFRLTEPLHDLGRAYMNAGDLRRAMGNFRRALHVARINDGLYTAAQIPVMGDMIETSLAMGQIDQADALYRTRYEVQKHVYHPGSPEYERATDEFVAWQRQAYLQGIGDKPSYYRLLDMHELHEAEIERLRSLNPDDSRLLPHLYDLMLVEYLISRYDKEKMPSLQINVTGPADGDPVLNGQLEGELFDRLRKANFRNGLQTLGDIERIEKIRADASSVDRARAYMAAGDWYLWWRQERRALEHYQRAWDLLEQDGLAETDPEALFPYPVELPVTSVFHPDGLVASEDVVATARVSLDVSPDGRPRDIEILEQDPAGDMGARVVLFRLLREVRFRPVLRHGEPVPYAGLKREYRYQY